MYGSVIFVLSSVGFWSVCCVEDVEEFDFRKHVDHNCCSVLASASGDIDISAMMPLSVTNFLLIISPFDETNFAISLTH